MNTTYLATTDNKSFIVTADGSYDAMAEVTRVLESEGVTVGRFSGSAKISAKKAAQAIAAGAVDLRGPTVATVENRKRLGSLLGM